MSYIKESKEKPFTLWDFSNNTKFIVCSSNIEYDFECCNIILSDTHYNDNNKCTEVEVIVWVSDLERKIKGYGRHTISIEEVPNKIDMKQLLIEISKTFGKIDFDEECCYIEVESKKMNFTF